MNYLDLLDWKLLTITASITAFVVSAFYTIIPTNAEGKPKISVNIMVFVVSLIITLLSTQFTGASVWEYQQLALQIFMTMAFAVLFYNYLGKWFLDSLFESIKAKLIKWFGKSDAPQP
jgi:hypothetical protein